MEKILKEPDWIQPERYSIKSSRTATVSGETSDWLKIEPFSEDQPSRMRSTELMFSTELQSFLKLASARKEDSSDFCVLGRRLESEEKDELMNSGVILLLAFLAALVSEVIFITQVLTDFIGVEFRGERLGSLIMEPWPRGRLEPDTGEGREFDLPIFSIGEEISERTGEYREG